MRIPLDGGVCRLLLAAGLVAKRMEDEHSLGRRLSWQNGCRMSIPLVGGGVVARQMEDEHSLSRRLRLWLLLGGGFRGKTDGEPEMVLTGVKM